MRLNKRGHESLIVVSVLCQVFDENYVGVVQACTKWRLSNKHVVGLCDLQLILDTFVQLFLSYLHSLSSPIPPCMKEQTKRAIS